MEQGEVLVGETRIVYRVVRSERRHRTIAFRLLAPYSVEVAAPASMTRSAVRGFVLDRTQWVLDRSADLASRPEPAPPPPRRRALDRDTLPFRGKELPVAFLPGTVRGVRIAFDGEAFHIDVPEEGPADERDRAITTALQGWYARRVSELVDVAMARWSPVLDAKPTQVIVRDQRRRWGSCAANGVIRLNWRVVLLPPELLDYVVVHELAHLRQANHSPAFWAVVETALPAWRAARKAIRAFSASAPILPP